MKETNFIKAIPAKENQIQESVVKSVEESYCALEVSGSHVRLEWQHKGNAANSNVEGETKCSRREY